MSDEELIARLRDACRGGDECKCSLSEAADRIEALVRQVKDEQAAKFKMRDERDAAKIAASNYADFNHTWRKRAERLAEALQEIATDEHPLGWIAIAALTTEKPHDRA